MKKDKFIKSSYKITKTITNTLGLTEKKNPSRNELKLGPFYLHMIFYIIISILSFGALIPYAYFLYSKYKYKESYIDNKRLKFTGELQDAYITFIFGYILFFLVLTSVNLLINNILPLIEIENVTIKNWIDKGITTLSNALPTILFTSFIITKLFKWQQKNVHFISSDEPSYYEIHLLKAIFEALIRKILSYASFGLGNPATIKFKESFLGNREFYSNKKLMFKGTIRSSYSWFLWRYYLIFITFGFYYPVYLYKYNKWVIINTHLNPNQEHLTHKFNLI